MSERRVHGLTLVNGNGGFYGATTLVACMIFGLKWTLAGLETSEATRVADGKKLRGEISVLKYSTYKRTSKIISQ
jgi:hypothetical protein